MNNNKPLGLKTAAQTEGKAMPSLPADAPSTARRGEHSNARKIKFSEPLDPELFNEIAEHVANELNKADQKTNGPTQLRKFYDEICMWTERVGDSTERYEHYLPFIRMLNAKAAYARGRGKSKDKENGLVDSYFVEIIRDGLKEVTSPTSLKHFKLFMEAVMGFYKAIRSN